MLFWSKSIFRTVMSIWVSIILIACNGEVSTPPPPTKFFDNSLHSFILMGYRNNFSSSVKGHDPQTTTGPLLPGIQQLLMEHFPAFFVCLFNKVLISKVFSFLTFLCTCTSCWGKSSQRFRCRCWGHAVKPARLSLSNTSWSQPGPDSPGDCQALEHVGDFLTGQAMCSFTNKKRLSAAVCLSLSHLDHLVFVTC